MTTYEEWKEYQKRRRREYYARNRLHIRKRDNPSSNPRRAAKNAEWREKNREKIREYQREWRKKNPTYYRDTMRDRKIDNLRS